MSTRAKKRKLLRTLRYWEQERRRYPGNPRITAMVTTAWEAFRAATARGRRWTGVSWPAEGVRHP